VLGSHLERVKQPSQLPEPLALVCSIADSPTPHSPCSYRRVYGRDNVFTCNQATSLQRIPSASCAYTCRAHHGWHKLFLTKVNVLMRVCVSGQGRCRALDPRWQFAHVTGKEQATPMKPHANTTRVDWLTIFTLPGDVLRQA